jgi:alpha-amylase
VSDPERGDSSPARLQFLFGIHNHQPAGNFHRVIAEATERAYHPFLALLRGYPQFRLAIHVSGSLLEWLKERASVTFDLLGELAARGQVELLTGGFYEPIIPVLPDWDKVGQIQHLSEFLSRHFGVHPRGMWLTERVWEPHLPKPLREAGVEYALVDDHHFALAGLDAERLGGYYLTEDGGVSLALFPISQRLRYLVPFAHPQETLAYLEERRSAGGLTLMDDGEKFGVWPGTYRLAYDERWLARFFEALLSARWLELSTFSDYLDRFPPCGRAYLPSASYREMGEWALPADAGAALEEAKDRLQALPDGERLAPLLRGGFWRNFLVKYPEVNDLHWKMLRLSRLIHETIARSPADPRLEEARIHLWRGQGNDAYWHGVFGGCYLPHLRRGVKQALISAERCLAEFASGATIQWSSDDLNGDGRVEITVRTPLLSLVFNPELGGSLTEIVYAPRELDLGDVFSRRPEAYHAKVKAATSGMAEKEVRTIHDRMVNKEIGLDTRITYDRFRRASLLDGLFPDHGSLDALDPWPLALLGLGDRQIDYQVHESSESFSIEFYLENPDRWPISIKKRVLVSSREADVRVSYKLRWTGSAPIRARWAVQWNLALTAGEAPGRFYRLPDHPSLGSRGEVHNRSSLGLVDEWADCMVTLGWERLAHVAWAPVETVSMSEVGFERVYQGSSLLLAWPVSLAPGAEWEEQIVMTIQGAQGVGHEPASNPR